MNHKLQQYCKNGKFPVGKELQTLLVTLTSDYVNQINYFINGYSVAEAPILVAAMRIALDMVTSSAEGLLENDLKSLKTFKIESEFLYETVTKYSTRKSIVVDESATKRSSPDDKSVSSP